MPEYSSLQLNNETIFDFQVGTSYIQVAKGKANYKMSRGTFKTKDTLVEETKLVYQGFKDNQYTFSDGKTILLLTIVKEKPYTKVTFKINNNFNRLSIKLKAHPKQKIFGCGEQFTKLNLKGESVPIWVSEHHSLKKLVKKYLREKFTKVNYEHISAYKDHQSYFAMPVFLTSDLYGVYCDIKHYATFDFNQSNTVLSFREIPSSITFFEANHYETLVSQLSFLTGIQPKLPDFISEGAVLAMQGGIDTIKEKIDFAKKQHVHFNAIWAQDWCGQVITKFGDQVYWNWELDEKRYADLADFIKELKKDNKYFLGYINPFLKENSPQYNEALSLDFLVKNQDLKPYLVKSTTFNAGMIDLTNVKAFNWYKEIIKKNMIQLGMIGWMADFSEYLPTDAVLYDNDALKQHNYWPVLWAKCNAEAIEETKGTDHFFFMRAGYNGSMPHTHSMWLGDQHVDYSDEYGLGSVVNGLLSMSLSGVGINHSDVGGYTTIFHMKRDAELLIRWAELALFTPMFRTHEGNLPIRNIQYDNEQTIELFAKITKYYSELSEYAKYVKEVYYTTGIPVIRPVFFYDQSDEAYKVGNKAFMYGQDVIVYPVIRPNIKSQNVYLPKGAWVHIITGKHYLEGYHEINTPLGTPCAFYKDDSQFKHVFDRLKTKG